MKSRFLLVLFLVCNLFYMNYAQSVSLQQNDYSKYYKQCNTAFVAMQKGDYGKSIEIYNRTFDEFYAFIDDLDNLRKCYLSIERKDEAYLVMKKMVQHGFKFKNNSYLVSSRTAISGMKDTRLNDSPELVMKLKQNYGSLRKQFLKKINYDKDKYLSVYGNLDRFVGYCRPKDKGDLISDIGFTSISELFLNYLDSEFIPSRSESDSWDDQLNIALVHMALSLKNETQEEFFLEKLREMVIKGNLSPVQYAVLFECIHVRNRKNSNSYYGMYFLAPEKFEDPSNIQFEILTPEDIGNIDQRRSDIFLPPLWSFAKHKNYKLPEKYKIK